VAAVGAERRNSHSLRYRPAQGAAFMGLFSRTLPGGLLHKQGPRTARLRAAPLPHSHHALIATPCLCLPQEDH
jgi:hypothetical protein